MRSSSFGVLAVGRSGFTYYVDNSGSDAANGLTPATAWQTVAKVNGTSLTAGQSVGFKRGGIWREQLTVPSSGSAGSFITFGAYGTGDNPILNGADAVTGFTLSTGAIYVKTGVSLNPVHVFQDSARLIYKTSTGAMVAGSYFWDSGASNLYVWTTDSAAPSTHTIEKGVRSGIDINGKSYLRFSYIDTTRCLRNGYSFQSIAGSADVIISNSKSSWNGLRGFGLGGYYPLNTSSIIFQNDIAHDNLEEGFWIGNGSNNGAVSCESYNNGTDVRDKGYVANGGGVTIGVNAISNYVLNCYIHDIGYKSGLLVESEVTGAAVAYNNSPARGQGTTSISVPYPSTVVQNDLLLLFVINKYPPDAPTTPAGWTQINQVSGGAGASGTDSGNIMATVYWRVADGGETGNLSVTITSGNASYGRMTRFTGDIGKAWSLAASSGSVNSSSTAWSATAAANPGLQAGDILVVLSGINSSLSTHTAESVSATGVTIGTQTERYEQTTTTGQKANAVFSTHVISTGTASAAPVFTMTATTAEAGASVFVRIRQVSAVPVGTIVSGNIFVSSNNGVSAYPILATEGSGTIISRNVIYGTFDKPLGSSGNGSLNESWYHNVLYQGGNNWAFMASSAATGLTFKNNIIRVVNTSGAAAIMGIWTVAQSGFTSDYNSLGPSPRFFYWEAGSDEFPTTLSAWVTVTGKDTNSIATDPLLNDPSLNDFTLQAGSPCINAGIALSGINDGYLGASPDIGAFERS